MPAMLSRPCLLAFCLLPAPGFGLKRYSPYGSGGYEYGDRVSNARNSDSSDYSAGQWLRKDDARDGPAFGTRGAAGAARQAQAEASQDHFNSENTPSHDDFMQLKVLASVQRGPDSYEYGDREANARNEDPSDYSVHQFLATDDARDGPANDEEGAAATKAMMSRAAASQDHFNSENTVGHDDDFVQLSSVTKKGPSGLEVGGYEYGDRESNARNEDPSDYSVHQFLATDDARDGPSNDEEGAAAAKAMMSRAAASQDHFNSENTPSHDDDFMQLRALASVQRAPDSLDVGGYEYGDRQANARNEDPSDYSVRQFLATDDARDGPSNDEEGAAATKAMMSRAAASQDHFNSENTPSHDDE